MMIESLAKHRKEMPNTIKRAKWHPLREYWQSWLDEDEGIDSKEYFEDADGTDYLTEYLIHVLGALSEESSMTSEGDWSFYSKNPEKTKSEFFAYIKKDLDV